MTPWFLITPQEGNELKSKKTVVLEDRAVHDLVMGQSVLVVYDVVDFAKNPPVGYWKAKIIGFSALTDRIRGRKGNITIGPL